MINLIVLTSSRFFIPFWRVFEDWLVREPLNVYGETHADEVIQLEEEAERSLFKLVHHRKHLDELIHSRKTEVDEQNPVDKHDMIRSI